MINPKTATEQMMFATVRLETDHGSGTGFIFTFKFSDNKIVPVIITNKHVINNNPEEAVRFSLHLKDEEVPNGKIDVNYNAKWFFHKNHDLCFCFAYPLFEQIKKLHNKDVFYVSLEESLIWDNAKLEELSAMEDVVMVGYPIGLWDKGHNLPLFRRGVTASHPSIDFNDDGIGVVDMACFPGSSGSPIFVLNENGYSDKQGTAHLGAKRVIFLGILFQGPRLNAQGRIIIENIPIEQKTSLTTPVMINLGYYIKASVISDFKEEIIRRVGLE